MEGVGAYPVIPPTMSYKKKLKHLSVPYFEGFCFPLGNEVEISHPLRLKKQWSTRWLFHMPLCEAS